MNTHHGMIRGSSVTSADDQPQNLDPQQIARLVALARAYPWIEFVESNQEWRRLLFLKWRYETDRIRP